MGPWQLISGRHAAYDLAPGTPPAAANGRHCPAPSANGPSPHRVPPAMRSAAGPGASGLLVSPLRLVLLGGCLWPFWPILGLISFCLSLRRSPNKHPLESLLLLLFFFSFPSSPTQPHSLNLDFQSPTLVHSTHSPNHSASIHQSPPNAQ